MRIIKKFYHGFEFLLTMLLYVASYPIAFIIYGKKKYWLISEVDFDARDNGIHFFKYLNKNHKEINSIYLISKNNVNYGLVKEIGEVVEPGSYKHMLVFIAAKAKISTLVHGCSPSYYITKMLSKIHGTGKNVALKHGIIKNVHPNYFKKNAHLDLICCGAKPEYDFVNTNFGYENGVARYTGLARFDALHDVDVKKVILVMPTWRRWLDGIKNKNDFINSDYFKKWESLLRNKKFHELVENNGFKIHFYVHPKLNKYLKLFNQIDSVDFYNSINGDDIQKELKDSAVLVTDYSSVFFDFAYMRKPIIFFQFDEGKYYENHYAKGYFDYRSGGFGPVCINEKEVIDYIEKNVKDEKIVIEKMYYERANSFFPIFDNLNCERIYNAISEIINK